MTPQQLIPQRLTPQYDEDTGEEIYDDGYFTEDGTWVYYADEEYEDDLNYDDEEETYQTYWIIEEWINVLGTSTSTVDSSSTIKFYSHKWNYYNFIIYKFG